MSEQGWKPDHITGLHWSGLTERWSLHSTAWSTWLWEYRWPIHRQGDQNIMCWLCAPDRLGRIPHAADNECTRTGQLDHRPRNHYTGLPCINCGNCGNTVLIVDCTGWLHSANRDITPSNQGVLLSYQGNQYDRVQCLLCDGLPWSCDSGAGWMSHCTSESIASVKDKPRYFELTWAGYMWCSNMSF